MASGTKGSTSFSYGYNSDGLRTKKIVGSQTYTYYWNGTQLAAMTITTGSNVSTLRFYYDAEGTPFYFDYNGTKYFYITNLQGDVVGIANENGFLGYYEYDAWGRILSINSASSNEYSALTYNPLRYRGYIYDTETGFYYLQSRYYDPAIRRFINADSYASTGQGFIGYNMFAYCNNNPIKYIDATGEASILAKVDWKLIDQIGLVVLHVITDPEYALKIVKNCVAAVHYSRNALNPTSMYPSTYDEEFFEDWDDSVSAKCHQFTAPNKDNIKYVSPDGKYEAIYDANGNLVTDPRDMGTYNHVPSTVSKVGHFICDVLPWIFFGNSREDDTTPRERWQSYISD